MGAAGVWHIGGSRQAGGRVEDLLEAGANGHRGMFSIHRAHVGNFAFSTDRLLAGQPEKDLEAGFVIEVMSAFALRGIAPDPRRGQQRISCKKCSAKASSNRIERASACRSWA